METTGSELIKSEGVRTMTDWVEVSSSNVARVRYDSSTMILEVEYHSGSVYQYFDVPETVYQQLIQSGSVGSFMHENIRGVYRYARL